MTTQRELEKELADLKAKYPEPGERWIRALVTTLENTSVSVQRGDGVMRLTGKTSDTEPPSGWIHVATGPKGISETFARTWDLYVDPEIHTVPTEVTEANLPIKILLGTDSAFA